jgi:hypothetical protein
MVCLFACRVGDYRFQDLELTKFEAGVLANFSPAVRGFLAWRRTLLFPCAILMAVGTILRAIALAQKYRAPPGMFIRDFLGPDLYQNFCPNPPCTAVTTLNGLRVATMLTDILLCLVSATSVVLLMLGARRWATYAQSSRQLRHAYVGLFVAPFILLLILPVAQVGSPCITSAVHILLA